MNGYEFILQFATEHPFLSFCLLLAAEQATTAPFRFYFRHKNIKEKGWPPEWLDADGDTQGKDKEDDKSK